MSHELHLLEHTLQQLLVQKQSIQLEINELTDALNEIDKTSDEVYRVMGNIMMKADKTSLRNELNERKKMLDLRINTLEKQETSIESQIVEMRKHSSPTKR